MYYDGYEMMLLPGEHHPLATTTNLLAYILPTYFAEQRNAVEANQNLK